MSVRERLLTGAEDPPSEPVRLEAGPIEALLVDGDLRYVRRAGVELVRRIYVAVRDLDWNTIPGLTSHLQIDQGREGFRVRFERRHTARRIDFSWTATITGAADGRIEYRVNGQALADNRFAKFGICIHHPIDGFTGTRYDARTPNGMITGVLPESIAPQLHLPDDTDLPMFDPFSELRLRHASGAAVRFDLAGDLWEMEDQRNWTDASYKSASTPAYLGYDHRAEPGTAMQQSVVVTTSEPTKPEKRRAPWVSVGPRTGKRMPPVGIGHGSIQSQVPIVMDTLRRVAPAHLRVDLHLGNSAWPEAFGDAVRLTEAIGCALELAVFVAGEREDRAALEKLSTMLASAPHPPARILALSDRETTTTWHTVQYITALLRESAVCPIVGGTDIYFTDLNRERPRSSPTDALAWSINPQIHASDELSLVENLAAQEDTVRSAMAFAPGASLHISPVTLRPRFNAVATPNATDDVLDTADHRQSSLFCAAWTLGSVAHLASAGVASVTYFRIAGPEGIVGTRPYPVASVLAEICSLAGAELLTVTVGDPLTVAAVAADTGVTTTILLTNLSREQTDVHIDMPDKDRATVRILDLDTVQLATSDPAAFAATGEDIDASGGFALTLGPYAVARLEMR